MQKKLFKLFTNYWETAKERAKTKLRIHKYRLVLSVCKLIADLITNAVIVVGILLVIFLTSITLSFSLSVFFSSHVLGFLASTLILSLTALIVLWKREAVNRYFAGLTIARYFEKRHETEDEEADEKVIDRNALLELLNDRRKV